MDNLTEEPFINRKKELSALKASEAKDGFVVIYGRRRIGKTKLIKKWFGNSGVYSQAIEAEEAQQIEQICLDFKKKIEFPTMPQNWNDFFRLLDMVKLVDKRHLICLDEFPYLVASSPSLPSIMQKWIDHRKNKNITFVVCGSCQTMMYETFLNSTSPLYGRATKILHMKPMSYHDFIEWSEFDAKNQQSSLQYSLVGGIPRYWELLNLKASPIENANELYFQDSAFMEGEPKRLLMDEKVKGLIPWAVLEAIGRGAEKPNEVASRLGIPQTQLSKNFQLLVDTNIVQRLIPFGENYKNSKRSLYKIEDPALRFWFYVYSAYRTRWWFLDKDTKKEMIHLHASKVFEQYIRQKFPESKSYWEGDIEIDLVQENSKGLLVGEIKFKKLTGKEKSKILFDLQEKWKKTKLVHQYPKVEFKVFGFLNE